MPSISPCRYKSALTQTDSIEPQSLKSIYILKKSALMQTEGFSVGEATSTSLSTSTPTIVSALRRQSITSDTLRERNEHVKNPSDRLY